MTVFCFSSDTDTNVAAAVGSGEWAYSKTQKSHGGIKPGDFVLLYSAQSKSIKCVGLVLTEPDFGVEVTDKNWKDTFYDPFKFKVISSRKPISLDDLKDKEGGLSLGNSAGEGSLTVNDNNESKKERKS